MPRTARLSRAFYDRLGDDVANELVGLLNVIDSGYQSELRTLNDTNFVRLDARLEQRFAAQEARIDARFAEQDARIAARFAEQDARIDVRFAEQDAKMEARFAEQDAKWEARFAEQDAKFEARWSKLEIMIERRIADCRHSLLRWMLGLWITTMVGVVGLYLQILTLR